MRTLLACVFVVFLALPTVSWGHGYVPRAEWSGPCRKTAAVDVNLGNAPETFVRAAGCQISGKAPSRATITAWALRLKTDGALRRVDVVRALCVKAGRTCELAWSDPWVGEAGIGPDCIKRFKRDVGAVVMFFFHCPDGVNCGMDWAGNHVRGMTAPHSDLAWQGADAYYNADNPGFWRHELRSAKAAGLQFILPNVYGPDMDRGQIDTLAEALAEEHEPVKIALFDDSWAWGHGKFGTPWATAPDMNATEAAAQTLYDAKWRPFFRKIPRQDWYLVDNRPVIYFYNAGTLKPASRTGAVLACMKALFAADFGVTPFVVVDDAFFADPAMTQVADSRFRWDTLSGAFAAGDGTAAVVDRVSRSTMGGRVMANAFARWDSRGRDAGEGNAQFNNRVVRGPELLSHVLDSTQDADSLVLATWNDLGEGTGVNEAYDYYYLGQWLKPDLFIQTIRRSQCLN